MEEMRFKGWGSHIWLSLPILEEECGIKRLTVRIWKDGGFMGLRLISNHKWLDLRLDGGLFDSLRPKNLILGL